MDTNDLGPDLCDQLGFSRLDFGAWNNVTWHWDHVPCENRYEAQITQENAHQNPLIVLKWKATEIHTIII